MKNVRYNIRACKTTDGKLFENASEADNHQRRLDFEHWYNNSDAYIHVVRSPTLSEELGLDEGLEVSTKDPIDLLLRVGHVPRAYVLAVNK